MADGTYAEIRNFLDDHARYLFAGTDFKPLTVTAVVGTLLGRAAEYGLPAPTLSETACSTRPARLSKRWLAMQPRATLADLNDHLAKFRHIYNHERPHRALGRRTHATAYSARLKACPAGAKQGDHWRRRIDREHPGDAHSAMPEDFATSASDRPAPENTQ